MERIRIGNDFAMVMAVINERDESVALDTETLSVILVGPDGSRQELEVEDVSGSVVTAKVPHEVQTALGVYRVEVWINSGQEGQLIGDRPMAFQLVPLSTQSGWAPERINIGNITMQLVPMGVEISNSLEDESNERALSAQMGALLKKLVDQRRIPLVEYTSLAAAKETLANKTEGEITIFTLIRGSNGRGVLEEEECEFFFKKSKREGYSVGDLLLVYSGDALLDVAAFRIALYDAKKSDGDFPGAEGLESAWDKKQVDRAAAFLDSRDWNWDLNIAAARADRALFGHTNGDYNMNNESEGGSFAVGVLGRPAGSVAGEVYYFANTAKHDLGNGLADFVQFAISKNDPTKTFVRLVHWDNNTNQKIEPHEDWRRFADPSTAESALTAAQAAQKTADAATTSAAAAQKTANSATTAAGAAQKTADAAATAAANAQKTADSATTSASSAQKTANSATTAAGAAQKTADAAATAAATAQNTADAAKTTADGAAAAVTSMEGTAKEAKEAAAKALAAAEALEESATVLEQLRLGLTEGCLMSYEPEQLNPEPVATYGDTAWLKRFYPYLIDYNDNEGTTSTPIGRLKNNNWLRYEDGTYAPTVGISEEMRAACDVELYLDAAGTKKLCDAGEYDAAAVYEEHGIVDLYNAAGEQVRQLLPWETTRTDLGIYKAFADQQGNPCAVTPVDNIVGASGKVWRGMLSEQASKTWDGIDVSRWRLAATGIAPGPITTKGNKVRSFHYAYDGTDTNTNGEAGRCTNCTLFVGGMTYPRVQDMHQVNNMNWARACNSDTTSPVPFAEGGYHALNTFITSRELLHETKNLFSVTLFGSGISSNDSCANEATWLANGGVRYKVGAAADWTYAKWNTTPNFAYNTNGDRVNLSQMLSYERAKESCLESQMAASFAAEREIPEGETYIFNGREYWYENVAGGTALLDGGMDVRIYSIRNATFSAYTTTGEATDVTVQVVLRMSLIDGMNIAGDIFAYTGGGYEMVAFAHGNESGEAPSGSDGVATVRAYLEPDQSKWLCETTITHNDGSGFDFEDSYEEIGEYENYEAYVRQHIPYGVLPVKSGGNATTGECHFLTTRNYFSTIIGARVRLAARFRAYAASTNASGRYCTAYYPASYTYRSTGGSALVRLGL